MTVLLSGTTPLNETCLSYTDCNSPFLSQSVSWSVAIMNLAAELKRKQFLSEFIVQYNVLISWPAERISFQRVRRQETCCNDYGLFKQLKHGSFIWEYNGDKLHILQVICRCWIHTKCFDDWSSYKRVKSILNRQN